jgi:phosphate acetyltransferase
MTDTDRTATAPSKHDRLIAAAQAGVATVTLVVHPCDEPSLRGSWWGQRRSCARWPQLVTSI